MPFNSTTSRDDAAPLIPEDVASEIIGAIPETSAIAKLARQLPNMSRKQRRMPVWESLPYAYFVNGDAGLKQTTKAKWRNVYINAEEIATILPIPDAVLDDSDEPIFEKAKPYIIEAAGALFDRAVLFGESAPSVWPDPIVDGAVGAGQVVTVGEVGDTYDDIMAEGGVLNQVEEDGYFVSGHLAQLGMKAKLRGLRDDGGTGQPIFVKDMAEKSTYTLDGEPLVFPRNGAFTAEDDVLMVSGAWDELVWSIRQDITYKVLTEAVINDADGNIIYNLAQQDMSALRVVFRLGWALPNPTNRLNADDETRFPFSVYAKSGAVGIS